MQTSFTKDGAESSYINIGC